MNITCIICSDQLYSTSDVYSTPCGHLFHYHCLLEWLEKGSRTCPQCRQKATEKTIHKLYFTQTNTEGIVDDVGTLQSKIDSLQFQLRNKDKDINVYKEKYSKSKSQCAGLRGEVAELEKTARVHDSVVFALKEQIGYFKSRSRERDKLSDEISALKAKVRNLENVELAVCGCRGDVEDMLRSEHDVHSLAVLAAMLKKKLVETESKGRSLEGKLKKSQTEVSTLERHLIRLEAENVSLKKEMSSLTSTARSEKEYLTEVITGLQGGEGVPSPVVRGLTESPMPLPRKKSVINKNERVKDILNSDSPYLPVKSSNVPLALLTSSGSQLKLGEGPSSIFKTKKKIENVKRPQSDDVGYSGLGGQCKLDDFPRASLKRPKSTLNPAKKLRKLAPLKK